MPASVYRCTNQSCPHVGVDREVSVTEVGAGLYSDPPVRCACGSVPRQVARFQADAPAPPERAVRQAPEKRTRKTRG